MLRWTEACIRRVSSTLYAQSDGQIKVLPTQLVASVIWLPTSPAFPGYIIGDEDTFGTFCVEHWSSTKHFCSLARPFPPSFTLVLLFHGGFRPQRFSLASTYPTCESAFRVELPLGWLAFGLMIYACVFFLSLYRCSYYDGLLTRVYFCPARK